MYNVNYEVSIIIIYEKVYLDMFLSWVNMLIHH